MESARREHSKRIGGETTIQGGISVHYSEGSGSGAAGRAVRSSSVHELGSGKSWINLEATETGITAIYHALHRTKVQSNLKSSKG